MKKDFYCPHCGSRDIAWDATAGWDIDAQAHDLGGILQNCDCNACGETGIAPREVDLTDAEATTVRDAAAAEPDPAVQIIKRLLGLGVLDDEAGDLSEEVQNARAFLARAEGFPADPLVLVFNTSEPKGFQQMGGEQPCPLSEVCGDDADTFADALAHLRADGAANIGGGAAPLFTVVLP